MKPRDYQAAAVASLFEYWTNASGNPIVALPTGTGKALIIAEFMRQAWALYPGTNIILITHVKELVEQNFATLLKVWPTAPAGIYSAGLGRKDINRPLTFAGVGSLLKAAHYFKPDLILIDECHTVSPKETTTYRKLINFWQAQNPFLKVAGLSATPFRLGQGMLVEPGGIFSDICFDMTQRDAFNWFLEQGYLKRLIPKATATEYDISGVHIAKTGDYNMAELQAAVDKDALTRAAVAEMIATAHDREHWLIFAAGIQHAEHVAAILVENGISAVCVHSKSGEAQRDEAVAAFKAGKIRALVNNGCFTTGFDAPFIDMIGVLRHTTSPGLWVQMLGRGTRPVWMRGFDLTTREGRLACIAAGVPNCLVLDFAKNTARLGPINDVKKPAPRGKKGDAPGDAPAKSCEVCLAYNHASARHCCECGAEFVFRVKIAQTAATDELIAGSDQAVEPVEEWFDVETVTYSKHVPWNGKKRGLFNRAVPSLRVTYNCAGVRAFSEYVCFEHEGHARASAEQWWLETVAAPYAENKLPDSVDEALRLADRLRQPGKIRVWINRKNPRVMFREF